MTCLFPSPRLPSVRWNPAQDALWTPCCLSENPGARKSRTPNLRFPRNPKANDTNQVYASLPQWLWTSLKQHSVGQNVMILFVFFGGGFFFLGLVWREASRAPSDPEASESGSTVRPGPELASSTWEAHLWILRLWSQCTFRSFSFLHDVIFSQLTNQHVSCSLTVSWLHAYQGSTRHRVHPGCLRKNEGMWSDLMGLFNYLHFYFFTFYLKANVFLYTPNWTEKILPYPGCNVEIFCGSHNGDIIIHPT